MPKPDRSAALHREARDSFARVRIARPLLASISHGVDRSRSQMFPARRAIGNSGERRRAVGPRPARSPPVQSITGPPARFDATAGRPPVRRRRQPSVRTPGDDCSRDAATRSPCDTRPAGAPLTHRAPPPATKRGAPQQHPCERDLRPGRQPTRPQQLIPRSQSRRSFSARGTPQSRAPVRMTASQISPLSARVPVTGPLPPRPPRPAGGCRRRRCSPRRLPGPPCAPPRR